jgi:CheY-like chemotaxis protein
MVVEFGHRALEGEGFEAVPCTSPLTALRLLRDERFDLLIVDCRMPGLDGPEICAYIRSQTGLMTPRNVPIIMACGYSQETMQEYLSPLAVVALQVPMRAKRLTDMVRSLLEGPPIEWPPSHQTNEKHLEIHQLNKTAEAFLVEKSDPAATVKDATTTPVAPHGSSASNSNLIKAPPASSTSAVAHGVHPNLKHLLILFVVFIVALCLVAFELAFLS